MSLVATPEMCFHCFDIIIDRIHSKSGKSASHKKSSSDLLSQIPNLETAIFVSWKKYEKDFQGEPDLRGCIGTHSVYPLHEGLSHFAIQSAFEDSRFEKMREDEIPFLKCTVSLIFGFENISDMYDWTVGVHGIKIEFIDSKNRRRGATFLPEVASDYGRIHQPNVSWKIADYRD
eukprot:TRINITY_DN338_c0_g1_i1.p2 TRINITY_DN338_c0_g1~~TRINITY_DN338_c0_g1_i1.p2  ORF type:complete len:175 (+),score=54.72 TRINITY_DN338_c0_g1_i1:36-560(+)